MPERAAGAGAATERRRRAPGARHRAGRGIARRPPQKEPGGARQCPRSAVPASVGREVLPDSGRGAAAAPLRERGRLYAERDAARHGSFAGCPARSGADVTSGAWGTHFSQPPPPPPAALAGGSVSGSVARRGRPLAARRARSTLVSGGTCGRSFGPESLNLCFQNSMSASFLGTCQPASRTHAHNPALGAGVLQNPDLAAVLSPPRSSLPERCSLRGRSLSAMGIQHLPPTRLAPRSGKLTRVLSRETPSRVTISTAWSRPAAKSRCNGIVFGCILKEQDTGCGLL